MPSVKRHLEEGVGEPGAEDGGLVQRFDQLGVLLQPVAADYRLAGVVGPGDAVQHPEQRQEDRHLQQQRQAGRQRVGVVVLVQLHRLAAEPLAIVAVLLLQLPHLGLQQLHRAGGLDLLDEQRDQRGPDHHGQHHDRQRPGPAGVGAENRCEQVVGQHQDAGDHPVERRHDRAADGDERVVPSHRNQQRQQQFHHAPRRCGWYSLRSCSFIKFAPRRAVPATAGCPWSILPACFCRACSSSYSGVPGTGS